MQLQRHQRRELLHKRLEKESGRVIEEMIWGGPKESTLTLFYSAHVNGLPSLVQAQELINFWQQNFKVQVETRSGIVRLHEDEDCQRNSVAFGFNTEITTQMKGPRAPSVGEWDQRIGVQFAKRLHWLVTNKLKLSQI